MEDEQNVNLFAFSRDTWARNIPAAFPSISSARTAGYLQDHWVPIQCPSRLLQHLPDKRSHIERLSMGPDIYISTREMKHADETRRLWCAGRTKRGGAGDGHGAEYLHQGAATGVGRYTTAQLLFRGGYYRPVPCPARPTARHRIAIIGAHYHHF